MELFGKDDSELGDDFLDACGDVGGEMRTGVPPEEGICSLAEGEISFNPLTGLAEIEDNTSKVRASVYDARDIYVEDSTIVVEGENSTLSLKGDLHSDIE